jgi:PPOX class probable F420-dependent enzyme
MTAKIPLEYRDLLEGPVVVSLVTIMPDGQPQATPIWCDYDGEHVIVNTARGRQKDRNMTANPNVVVLAIDPQNPYRWIEVRCTVASSSEEGAIDVINGLSKLYRGNEDYYASMPDLRGKETRVTYKIRPDRINARG